MSAVPAVVFGILLGPLAAKFIDADRWGTAAEDQKNEITLVSQAINQLIPPDHSR